jgi:hypothetical protein
VQFSYILDVTFKTSSIYKKNIQINFVENFYGMEVTQLEKKYSLFAWKNICTSFNQGGLGIINLKLMNKPLLCKL